MKLLFFDTETTGLRPGQICQLSYIIVERNLEGSKTYGKNFFFTVDYVEPGAEAVHGFSVDKLMELSEGDSFETSYDEFLKDFSESDVIIGHNVSFDIKYITEEFNRVGVSYKPKNIYCSMKYFKPICKIISRQSDYKNPKLSELTEYLKIDEANIERTAKKIFSETGSFHDARFDTAAVYLSVVKAIKMGVMPAGYFSELSGK